MQKDFCDFPCSDSINISNSYLCISVIKKDKITYFAIQIIRGININSVFQLLSAYILCCIVHIQSAGNSLCSSSNVRIYFITFINYSFYHLDLNIMFITNNFVIKAVRLHTHPPPVEWKMQGFLRTNVNCILKPHTLSRLSLKIPPYHQNTTLYNWKIHSKSHYIKILITIKKYEC